MSQTITLNITTSSKKEDIEFPREEITLTQLFLTLKKELEIQNCFEIFIKVPPNNPLLLSEENFDKLFNQNDQSIISLIIYENFDFEDEVDTIFNEIEEEKKIRIQSLLKGKDKFNPNDVCIKCGSSFTEAKFLCCICDTNATFCHQCEYTHEHPMIKYKTPGLSAHLKEMFIYLSNGMGKTNINSGWGKSIELSTLFTYPLTLRVNKTTQLMVKVKWNGYQNEPYTLVIKNYHDMLMTYQYTDSVDKKDKSKGSNKEFSDLFISFTPEKKGIKYEVVVYFYLNKSEKFSNSIVFNIEVNEDLDEEKLNNFFSKYPEVVALPKKNKEQIKLVFEEKISTKPIDQIYAILKKHKWVIEHSVSDLTKS